MTISVLSFLCINRYLFDGLLVAILLAMLPVSPLLSNLTAQEVKKVDTEVVQSRGYPMHQFHPLPGAERTGNNSSGSGLGYIGELSEFSSGARLPKD